MRNKIRLLAALAGIAVLIDRQPTAYDVDKVCRKINENKEVDNWIDADHAIQIIKTEMKG